MDTGNFWKAAFLVRPGGRLDIRIRGEKIALLQSDNRVPFEWLWLSLHLSHSTAIGPHRSGPLIFVVEALLLRQFPRHE
jgi:hypothetical protein